MGIDLTLLNKGELPAYITSATLKSRTSDTRLDFIEAISPKSKAKPIRLEPGEPFHATVKMGKQEFENVPDIRQLEEEILRNVCKIDSYFEILTSRSGRYTFSAIDVCGEDIEGWPQYFFSKSDSTNV